MKHKKLKPRVGAKNFVEVSKLSHGETYDYSKTVYTNAKTDVLITCRRHGDFWQNPMNHAHNGTGCGKCNKGDSPEEFFSKAAAKHNNFYDYSKSVYFDSKSKVLVTCPIHGDFEVIARRHVKGFGCARCSGHFKFTEKDFVARAVGVYGDRFSYEDSGFAGTQQPATVTCKLHGKFQVKVSEFLAKRTDCEICAPIHKVTQRRFIHKSKQVHGDAYSYTLTGHKVSGKKLPIICKEHGIFWQSPSCHMTGRGCRHCSSYGFDRSAPASLYILVAPGLVKIGITNRSPEDRAKKINLSCDHNFTAHKHWQFEVGEHAEQIEKMSLALLRQTLESPTEMFDGYTETFLNTTTEFVEQTITKVAQSLGLAI